MNDLIIIIIYSFVNKDSSLAFIMMSKVNFTIHHSTKDENESRANIFQPYLYDAFLQELLDFPYEYKMQ